MGGAVSLEGPYLHLAEALATELGLAAQRLLGDEGVRAGRPGMDLVLDQVDEFEHVYVADGDRLVESIAGAAVVEGELAGGGRRHALFLVQLLYAFEDLVVGGFHPPPDEVFGLAQNDGG